MRYPATTAVALLLLSVALFGCSDSLPSAAEQTEDISGPAIEGPVFANLQYESVVNPPPYTVWAYAAVMQPTPGARYGFSTFTVECNIHGELTMYLGQLPDSHSEELLVYVSMDDGEPDEQMWSADRAYVAPLGLLLFAPDAERQLEEVSTHSLLEVAIPELDFATSVPLNLLRTAPTLPQLFACGESSSDDSKSLALPSDYQPVVDANGETDDGVGYLAEQLRGNRVRTTIWGDAADSESSTGLVRLSLSCNASGKLNLKLTNLPQPDPGEHGLGRPPRAIRVDVSVGEAPIQSEGWLLRASGETTEAENLDSSGSLVYALAQANVLNVSVPELEVKASFTNLPRFFRTPVQGNLGHCGYYAEN